MKNAVSLIFLGADHAGFDLKERLKPTLERLGFVVQDLSPRYDKNDDYPVHGFAVAKAVVEDSQARGILICGSGEGISMAANRIPGARALVGEREASIKRARNDEDANILALSGWDLSLARAMKLIHTFLQTPASKAARHRRRMQELDHPPV